MTNMLFYIYLGTVVAFNAHTVVDTTPAKGQVYVFSQTFFNHGDGYNNGTGVFTAPVSGVYMFTVHLCSLPNKYVFFAIVKTGWNEIVKGVVGDQDANVCHVATAVTALTNDEKVWVQCTHDQGTTLYADGHRLNTLAGALLQEIRR